MVKKVPRFRMGTKMRGILEILQEQGGLTQTGIIMKHEGLKTFKKRKRRGAEQFYKPREEAEKFAKQLKLENPDKFVEIFSDPELPNAIISMYKDYYEYVPRDCHTLASALAGKHIGQGSAPYNLMGRLMAVRLSRDPEMKDSPVVRAHFDWVNDYNKWNKEADRLYASFSQSIGYLLKWRLIRSNYSTKRGGVYSGHPTRRWYTARYRLTKAGRRYLETGDHP